MNLLTMLLGSFASDASVNSLSHKTGVSSSMLTKLIPLAIPILLKALTNNASSAGGAQSLLTALGQHSNKRSMAQQIDEVGSNTFSRRDGAGSDERPFRGGDKRLQTGGGSVRRT